MIISTEETRQETRIVVPNQYLADNIEEAYILIKHTKTFDKIHFEVSFMVTPKNKK